MPIVDMLSCAAYDPLGMTVVHDYQDALPELEGRVAEQIIAGYTQRETLANLGITMQVFRDARASVREKAMEYLV